MGALFLFKTTSPFKNIEDLGFYIGQMQISNHGVNVVFTGSSFEKECNLFRKCEYARRSDFFARFIEHKEEQMCYIQTRTKWFLKCVDVSNLKNLFDEDIDNFVDFDRRKTVNANDRTQDFRKKGGTITAVSTEKKCLDHVKKNQRSSFVRKIITHNLEEFTMACEKQFYSISLHTLTSKKVSGLVEH